MRTVRGAALLSVLLAVVTVSSGPKATGALTPGLPGWAKRKQMTVLVDSVLLGASPVLRVQRPRWRVRVRGKPALMIDMAERELRAIGRRVAPLVVVGLGYNSLWERRRRRHAFWARRFDRDAVRLIRTLRRLGAREIVWVTLREPTAKTVPPHARDELGQYNWYFPYVNGRLRWLDRRIDDLVLANWAAVSRRAGITYDSIHVNQKGARIMSRLIRRTIKQEALRQAEARRK